MKLLEVKNISKKQQQETTVSNISFTQGTQQKIAIAGETGSGKTTLLKMIAGLIQPDEGEILLNGKKVPGPNDKLLPGHPRIAYLSQYFELHNNYIVEDLIWFENKLGEEAASDLFSVCHIDHLLKRKTSQLSGGEKQRIALCMLLIQSPQLLLLDEPFSNLDMQHKQTLRSVLDVITDKLQITCILTSHEPQDLLSWAEEIIVLQKGSLLQQADPETIYRRPATEYVAGLTGKYNLITPKHSSIYTILTREARQNIIFRPENVSLSTQLKAEMQGEVKKIIFCGSYYDIEVQVGHTMIIARALQHQLHKGDTVFVTIDSDKLWFL